MTVNDRNSSVEQMSHVRKRPVLLQKSVKIIQSHQHVNEAFDCQKAKDLKLRNNPQYDINSFCLPVKHEAFSSSIFISTEKKPV